MFLQKIFARPPLLAIGSILLTAAVWDSQGRATPLPVATPAQTAPVVQTARVPGGGIEPQLVALNGSLHLIYFQGDAVHGNIFYVHSQDDGAKWSAPLRVNSQSGSAVAVGAIRGAHLAIGRGGRAFVVWNGSDVAAARNALAPPALREFGAAPLLFARLNDAGDAFEPQRTLLTRSFNLDGGASVAADETGRVYTAWHANVGKGQDEGERQVLLSVSNDDGRTFSPERPVWSEPTGACGCCQLRLMAGGGGRVSLLYRSAREVVHRDTFFLASSDGGRTFTGSKVQEWQLGACPMSSYALAPRGAQTVGAWESNKRVHFAALGTGAAPSRITDAPNGENQKCPALAVNAKGQTLLAWTEGTSWARGGNVCWEVLDANGVPIPGASGKRDGVPAWSFPAAFARADGSFEVFY